MTQKKEEVHDNNRNLENKKETKNRKMTKRKKFLFFLNFDNRESGSLRDRREKRFSKELNE